MSTETSSAAAQPPRRRADELLTALAERIGGRLNASTVYGEPIERDGVTVVPVTAIRVGIGAGGGTDPAKGQEGEGGGGGGSATPAGYIELKGGRSRFVPVVHPVRMAALVCGTLLAGLLILRPDAAPRRSPIAAIAERRRR
jgi:uncharacterized spore protein YtfJ